MQEFIRRNFWAVILVVIGIGSFLAAGLVSESLGILFLGGQSKAGASAETAAAAQAQPVVTVKPRFDTALLSAASERNVFDAEPVVIEEFGAGEGDGSGDNPGAGQAVNIAVRLLGTLVSNIPEWSMATIVLNNESKLVRRGIMLMDTVEVADIQPKYIVLRQGEKISVVTLWDAEGPTPPAKAPGDESALGAGAVASKGGEDDPFAAGIQKKGPNDYQIDKNMLEEQLQDLTKIGMQARIVPNYEAGKYAGFRLVGIRPNSLYKAIGLQSGDLLRRINGEEIDTPNKAIQLFESLRSSPQIAIDVVRRGKKVTMNYTIQ